MKKTESECRAELAQNGLEADEINEIVAGRLAKGSIVPDESDVNPDTTRVDAAAEAWRLHKAKAAKKAKDEDFEFEAEETTMSGDDDDEDYLGNGSMDPEPKAHRMDKGGAREAANLLKAEIRKAVAEVVGPQLAKAVSILASRVDDLDAGLTKLGDLVDAQGTLAKGSVIRSEVRDIKTSIANLEKAFKGARGDFRGVTAADVDVVPAPGDPPAPAVDLYKGASDFLDAQRRTLSRKEDNESLSTLRQISDAYATMDPNAKLELARELGYKPA